IINFIKIHQGCSVSDVVRHLTNLSLASKKTVDKIIQELVDNGVLKKSRMRKNSRSNVLYIISENPLTFLPDQLTKVQSLYEELTEVLIQKFLENADEWLEEYNHTLESSETAESQHQTITNDAQNFSDSVSIILKDSVIINII